MLSRLLQVLHADFRLDYCRLWQALIKGNISGVERYSRRLGAGDLYPLFACVLTARSWTSVNAGISSLPVTQSEVGAHAQFYSPVLSFIAESHFSPGSLFLMVLGF